jgi:hypothetical protein
MAGILHQAWYISIWERHIGLSGCIAGRFFFPYDIDDITIMRFRTINYTNIYQYNRLS